LILPVYKTTKHMKRQFSNMHDQMHQRDNNTQQQTTHKTSGQTTSKPKAGEYIDFEETKN